MEYNFSEETSLNYPKVLVVALGRINEGDLHNNGLLLRNLFKDYPKENIAQIYSSGNNGDNGFFGHYYCISKEDRRLGRFFYLFKGEERVERKSVTRHSKRGIKQRIRSITFNLFIKTGLYELLFRVKISKQMEKWIEEFKPDIIFAQGYNLSFTLLPILIKKQFKIKLAFLSTDDWPRYLYSGMLGENKVLSIISRRKAIKLSNELIKLTDVPFAFGHPMAKEYEKRYGKQFNVISHSDEPKRFELCQTKRLNPPEVYSIITIGNFNRYRWPLLLDLNEACEKLNAEGISVRVSILSSAIETECRQKLNDAKYIDIYEDPGNDNLPCYLKGADLLFLPEGFDGNFVEAIRLSISSKAHLYMFSKKPIIVYAHKNTGIAQYAIDFGWAKVLTDRSIVKLADVIKELIMNTETVKKQAIIAYDFALETHDNQKVSSIFQQKIINS